MVTVIAVPGLLPLEWHAENLSAGSEPRPGPGYGMTESESDQPGLSSEQGRAFSGDQRHSDPD